MISLIAALLVGFVALQHAAFLYLEMFLWTRPTGRRIFGMSQEQADSSRVLAANQGLYNGFLAAGLIWGLVHPNPQTGWQIQLFFLICVLIAAIFGGFTVKKSILLVQGLPAALATIVLFL